MLVISPVPTNAADPAPDYLAFFDACPKGVIPSAGFVDVPSAHPSVRDIDCVGYYGITNGTGGGSYSPDLSATREYMALFLVRLARLVGIRVPSGAETPFEDVAD